MDSNGGATYLALDSNNNPHISYGGNSYPAGDIMYATATEPTPISTPSPIPKASPTPTAQASPTFSASALLLVLTAVIIVAVVIVVYVWKKKTQKKSPKLISSLLDFTFWVWGIYFNFFL